MRLSTEQGDPGFAAWEDAQARGLQGKVILNGVERVDVHTADEEQRFVIKACRNEDGLVLTPDQTKVATERLEGDVVIMLEPRRPA